MKCLGLIFVISGFLLYLSRETNCVKVNAIFRSALMKMSTNPQRRQQLIATQTVKTLTESEIRDYQNVKNSMKRILDKLDEIKEMTPETQYGDRDYGTVLDYCRKAPMQRQEQLSNYINLSICKTIDIHKRFIFFIISVPKIWCHKHWVSILAQDSTRGG